MNEYFVNRQSFPCQLCRRSIHSAAFSLIELVLALGVMSFGLISIVGLLPVGLSHFRKAMDQTVQAQITQEVTHMIQRTPFDHLGDLGSSANPTLYYFDHEGCATTEQEAIYTVKASVASDTDLNALLGPAWPSGNSTGKALQNVKAVHIVITNRASPNNSQTITTYVANAGL